MSRFFIPKKNMSDKVTFDLRNDEKQLLNNSSIHDLSIDVRQIRFVKAGKNIWSEQNGKTNFSRPFLVLKKVGNQIFWTYLTTGWASHSKRYFDMPLELFFEEKNKKEWSKLCLWHLKTIDLRRFIYQIGVCDDVVFSEIKKILYELYR